MRILGAIEPNILIIHDKISGEDLELYYRVPSTTERVNYSSKLFKKVNGSYIIDMDYKLQSALNILVGIGPEQFAGPDGKAISSDPKAPNYCKNWKDLIFEHAAECLAVLADSVFDNLTTVTTRQSLFTDDPENEKESLPLELCSTDSHDDALQNVEPNV